MRFYWSMWAAGAGENIWQDVVMITSNDGYYFAEGARDIIAGFHQTHDLSPVHEALAQITAFFGGILPFKFDLVLLHMPTFFASLVVIPIILIAKECGETMAGFFGAILTSTTLTYYNRTMAGYYDTDMLIIALIMFLCYGLVRLYTKKDFTSLVVLSVSSVLWSWYYFQGVAVTLIILGMFFLMVLVKERKNYLMYFGIILVCLGNIGLPLWAMVLLFAAILAAFHFKPEFVLDIKALALLSVVVVAGFFLNGLLEQLLFRLTFYFTKGATTAESTLHFFDVNQTISEAQKMGFWDYLVRLSLSRVTIVFAIFGFLVACVKHRVLLLLVPTFVFGLLGFTSGVRFGIYACVGIGFGFAFGVFWLLRGVMSEKTLVRNVATGLLVVLASWLGYEVFKDGFFVLFDTEFIKSDKPTGDVKFKIVASAIFMLVSLGYLLYLAASAVKLGAVRVVGKFAAFFAILMCVNFNVWYIYNFKASVVLTNSEVVVLDRLKQVANREDYCVSWWDWGYPIRYFSDVKTLVDGGKHNGWNNYAVSYAITRQQVAAANMLRFDVEYTESSFKDKANLIYDKRTGNIDYGMLPSNVHKMLKDHGYEGKSSNMFLGGDMFRKDLKLPPKTRDVYFYLPFRIVNIFQTISLFSWLNLDDGKPFNLFYFDSSDRIVQEGDHFVINDRVKIAKDGKSAIISGTNYPLKAFVRTNHNEQGALTKELLHEDKESNSRLYVIYMQDFNRIFIMNEEVIQTAFVQLFMLENFDPELFEPVAFTPTAKLYKLKR